MFGLSAPIAMIIGIGTWSLPPSPRWLLLREVQGHGGRTDYKEEAVLALSKLRGRPPGDKISKMQIDDALISLKSQSDEQESEGSLLDVVEGPSLKAFTIGGGLVLFQQVKKNPWPIVLSRVVYIVIKIYYLVLQVFFMKNVNKLTSHDYDR